MARVLTPKQLRYLGWLRGKMRGGKEVVQAGKEVAENLEGSILGAGATKLAKAFTDLHGDRLGREAEESAVKEGGTLKNVAQRVFGGISKEDKGGILGWLGRRHVAAQKNYQKTGSIIRGGISSVGYSAAETTTALANKALQDGIGWVVTLPGIKNARQYLGVMQESLLRNLAQDHRAQILRLRAKIAHSKGGAFVNSKYVKDANKTSAPPFSSKVILSINDKFNSVAKMTRSYIARAQQGTKDNPYPTVNTVAEARLADVDKVLKKIEPRITSLRRELKFLDSTTKAADATPNIRVRAFRKQLDIANKLNALTQQRQTVLNSALSDVDKAHQAAGLDLQLSSLNKANRALEILKNPATIHAARERYTKLAPGLKALEDFAKNVKSKGTSEATSDIRAASKPLRVQLSTIKTSLGLKDNIFKKKLVGQEKLASKLKAALFTDRGKYGEARKTYDSLINEARRTAVAEDRMALIRQADSVYMQHIKPVEDKLKVLQKNTANDITTSKTIISQNEKAFRSIVKPLGEGKDTRKIRVDSAKAYQDDLAAVNASQLYTKDQKDQIKAYAAAREKLARAHYRKTLGGSERPILPTAVVSAGALGAGVWAIQKTRDELRRLQKMRAQEKINQRLREHIDTWARVQYPDMDRYEREQVVEERLRQHRLWTQKAEEQNQLIALYKHLADQNVSKATGLPMASIDTPSEVRTKLAKIKSNKKTLGKLVVKPKKKK